MIGKLLTLPVVIWTGFHPNSPDSSYINNICLASSSPKQWIDNPTSSQSSPAPFRSRTLSSYSSSCDSPSTSMTSLSNERLTMVNENGFIFPDVKTPHKTVHSLNRDGTLYHQVNVRLVHGRDGYRFAHRTTALPSCQRNDRSR